METTDVAKKGQVVPFEAVKDTLKAIYNIYKDWTAEGLNKHLFNIPKKHLFRQTLMEMGILLVDEPFYPNTKTGKWTYKWDVQEPTHDLAVQVNKKYHELYYNERVGPVNKDRYPYESLDNVYRDVYLNLEVVFTTQDAYKIGDLFGMSQRSIDTFIKNIEVFKKLKHGVYMKIGCPSFDILKSIKTEPRINEKVIDDNAQFLGLNHDKWKKPLLNFYNNEHLYDYHKQIGYVLTALVSNAIGQKEKLTETNMDNNTVNEKTKLYMMDRAMDMLELERWPQGSISKELAESILKKAEESPLYYTRLSSQTTEGDNAMMVAGDVYHYFNDSLGLSNKEGIRILQSTRMFMYSLRLKCLTDMRYEEVTPCRVYSAMKGLVDSGETKNSMMSNDKLLDAIVDESVYNPDRILEKDNHINKKEIGEIKIFGIRIGTITLQA